MPTGGFKTFKVERLSHVAGQIQALLDRAEALGIHAEVVDAFARMEQKLPSMPATWGDPPYTTELPGGVVCHATEPPLNVHFFTHEEQRTVCILDIHPLAGNPLVS